MIRIRGDEERGYTTLVSCDDCYDSVVFRPGYHGLWVGSTRQVRNYLTGREGWVWDAYADSFYCPAHFEATSAGGASNVPDRGRTTQQA